MDLAKFIELDRLAREDGKKYSKRRFIFEKICQREGKHFVGIVGPRGAGKTILLKQLACVQKDSFYLSLDTVQENLFEIVKKLNQDLKINLFLIDEVHFHPQFDEGLKKIYDFLNVQLIFTSSTSLALFDSAYDLSRRVKLEKLYPFSFLEYLFFKHDLNLKPLSLRDIIDKQWEMEIFRYADTFREYLEGGILPFALQEPLVLPLLKNIINAVIMKDIPRVGKVPLDELETIERMLAFIGKSSIDGINYSSLSQNLGITKYKAEQYVGFLEKAFILHRIFPKGTNVLREPKILMALPYRLLYKDFEEAIGGLREDFFVEVLKSLDINFYYLKSTRGAKTPDFLVPFKNEEIIFEIGGKGKGRQQFKGIEAKNKIILTHSLESQGARRPLLLFGFLNQIE